MSGEIVVFVLLDHRVVREGRKSPTDCFWARMLDFNSSTGHAFEVLSLFKVFSCA